MKSSDNKINTNKTSLINSVNDNMFRESGIRIIGNVPWGTHFCQFYQSKEDLLNILVPYFVAGLANNEFCMWVTSEPLGVEDAIIVLKKEIPMLDKYFKKKQLEILDYKDWYLKSGKFESSKVLDGWVKKYNIALENGFSGLRLTGNTLWLEKDDWRDFTHYEKAVNDFIKDYKMIAICTYSTDKCGVSEIADVISNHNFAIIKRDKKWDIIESSEQKRLEKQLNKSKTEAARLVKYSPAGIYEINFKTQRFSSVNDAMCELLGYTKEELLSINPFDILDSQSKKLFQESINLWLAGIKPDNNIEYKVFTKDGREIYASLTIEFIKDKYGKPIGASVIAYDVTQRRKIEEALKKSEEKYRALFDSMSEGFALGRTIYDKYGNPEDYIFLEANDAFEKQSGIKRVDIINKPITKVIPGIEKDPADWIGIYGKVAKRGKPVHFEKYAKNEKKWYSIYIFSPFKDHFALIFSNITERKQVEEALLASEERYKGLVESQQELIVRVDTEDCFTFVNDAYCKKFGLKREEVLGKKSFKQLVHPDDIGYTVEAMKNLYKPPYRINVRQRVLAVEGVRWVEWEVCAIKDKKGKIVEIQAIGRDIHDNKLAVDTLKKNQEQLNLAQEITKLGSWELDLVTGNLIWSDEVYRIFDIDKREFKPTYKAFLDSIHPDDRKLVDEAYTKSLKTKQAYNIIHRLKLPNNKVKYVREICETFFDSKGKPIKSVGSVQDITNQVNAELELKRIATFPQLNPNPIIELDMTGKIIYMNPAMQKIVNGVFNISEHSMFGGIDPKKVNSKNKDYRREVEADNKWYMQQITYVPQTNTVRIYHVDITDRKILEQQKDEFLNIASHELKTPLTSIKAFSQILKRRFSKDKTGLYFASQIDIQTDKLTVLINDLMDTNKITAGKLKIKVKKISLNDLVNKVIEDYKYTTNVHKFIKTGLVNNKIMGDEDRLYQVLTNLISNAVKYSPTSDKIIINIKEDGQNIFLSVKDFGIGIPKDHIARVFERYYRARDDQRGFGLGLYISKEIIEQHKGKIWVKSREGKGTTFYISLPIAN